MTREEVQQHFWQTYARDMCKHALKQVDQYYRQHKEELAKEFAESFIAFCRYLQQQQIAGEKREVGLICCSMLYTALLQEQQVWRFDAYDKTSYLDEQECSLKFDTSWLFRPLYETCLQLEQERKKYAGKISSSYIDTIKRRQAYYYLPYAVLIARQALKEAVWSEAFSAIKKEPIVEIRLGEYHDGSERVYCHDVTPKDSAKIKRWLEKKLRKSYFCIALTGLDLSDGDYSGITLSYTRMSNTLLHHVNLSDTLLYGTELRQCSIDGSDFSYSQISGAIFDHAIIHHTTFQHSYGSATDLYQEEGTEDEMRIDILIGASFCESQIKESNLSYSELEKVDFRGATLSDVSFRYSNLEGAIFKDAILTYCDFRGANLSRAQFPNTLLTDCQFEEANLHDASFSADYANHADFSEIQKQQISTS